MSALWRRDCLYQVQVVGLALRALEPDEEIDVVEHLPRCPSCRAMLHDAERVLAGLGASVPPEEPPAVLRGRILAAAAETHQDLTAEPATSGPDPQAHPPARPATRRRARSRPAGRLSGGLTRRGHLVAVSLAVAGVLITGGLAAYSAQVTAERDEGIAQARTLGEIVTGLDEPGTLHATLAGTDGSVVAAVVVQNGVRTLVTAGLAPNAIERETYVLWGIGDSGPRAVGTFDITGTGTDVRTVGPDIPADGFVTYAISIEPGRAAPVSPSAVVAIGDLEA